MAKDDYDRIVCLILVYLYSRIKGKTEEKPEVYLQPMTNDFPVSEEYFNFILQNMSDSGLISGIKFIKAWGGDVINLKGMSDIQITEAGIHYLLDNDRMRSVMEWLRDHAVSLPGMVTTVLGILQRYNT